MREEGFQTVFKVVCAWVRACVRARARARCPYRILQKVNKFRLCINQCILLSRGNHF
jgi:hypothetical protein